MWKDAAGKAVDAMKVEDLLAKVSGLRASSFETAAHASLKSPVLTVTAVFDKGKDVVTFGRAGMDVRRAVRTNRGRPSSRRRPSTRPSRRPTR